MVESTAATPLQRFFGWTVHFYTATGTVVAFAAVLATLERNYRAAFLWLVAATVIDSTDGLFARLANVKERTPGFDGARLDDIVDYLTYVFVPVLILYLSGRLSGTSGLVVAALVLLSSAYGFASLDAKSADHYFIGFPSYWNIVAVYLFAAELSPMLTAVVLITLSALVFVRIGYVYPSRTPVLRRVTISLGFVWAVMVLAIILAMPRVPRPLLISSLFFPVYYIVLSLVLHSRRRAA